MFYVGPTRDKYDNVNMSFFTDYMKCLETYLDNTIV